MTVTGYDNYDRIWLPLSRAPARTIWGVGTNAVYAGSGSVKVVSSGKGEHMYGGAGDDTFDVNNPHDLVTAGTSGVDTIVTTYNYVLPSGVRDMVLNGTWNKVVGVGNSLANVITADRAGETLMGAGGDDVLVSGGGDLFLYQPGAGKDVIYNFHAGSWDSDVVRLTGYGFTSFSQVHSAMTQVGSDVVLRLSSTDLIDFKNTTLSHFTAANFELGVNKSAMHLVFDDEFNSLSLWNPATHTGHWQPYYDWGNYASLADHTILGSQEKDVNVDPNLKGTGSYALGLNPFSLSNGVLTISGRPTPAADKAALWNYPYVSGMLDSRASHSQTYGYFEMRAQFPSTPHGLWPAFWLLPEDRVGSQEIDVFEEVADQPNTIHETVHWDTSTGAKTYISWPTYVPNLFSGFHTYGLLWTPQTITWFIDGSSVGSVKTPADMNKPMYMITNLSIGGNWPGSPDSTTKFPVQYKIDYIRAYSLGTTTATQAAATASSVDTTSTHTTTDTAATTTTTSHTGAVIVSSVNYALTGDQHALQLTVPGLTGTGNPTGHNYLASMDGGDTLIGGAGGHDVFIVSHANDVIRVAAGTADETVDAYSSFALPANVQNLTGKGGAAMHLTGNGMDNFITAAKGADILTGGGGADTFVFAPGDHAETITDFTAGGAHDRIDISAYQKAGITATFVDHSAYATVHFSNGDMINLEGVHAAALHVSGHYIL